MLITGFWIGWLCLGNARAVAEGDVIVTQNDVRAGDTSTTSSLWGWTMDDHHPGGIAWKGEPNIFHPAPSPSGSPYRALYSRNVTNLFCAGRNISVTHAALERHARHGHVRHRGPGRRYSRSDCHPRGQIPVMWPETISRNCSRR